MNTATRKPSIYDGDGDRLMHQLPSSERIVLLPDSVHAKDADPQPHIRILWGQHLLDDLLAGRYRSLVCGVNLNDNTLGTIGRLAKLLPTSQWDATSITEHANRFAQPNMVTVVKFDMDMVEVLALLRPRSQEWLTTDDLSRGFRIVSEMIARKPQRRPTASVSFLGSRTNLLRDPLGHEPSLETVLRLMYKSGFSGDVYPTPAMWESATGVYARYPFPASLEAMREGGF